MKRDPHPHRPCIAAAIIAAVTLPLTSVAAQEAVTPTVQPTVSAPAAAPAPAPAAPATVFKPQQAVVQPTPPRAAPPVEAAAPAETATPAPRAERRVPRPAPRRAAVAPRAVAAPVAVAPVAASVTPPAPAPVPEAALPEAAPAVPPEVTTPPVAAGDPEVVSETPVSSTPWLAIAAVAALIIAGLAFFFRRRSRREDYEVSHASYVPTDETGAPVPEVDLAERPWIRLALQPTKAESHGDEQTVDYQLIVENEGSIPARDVRVSSFLTGIAGASPSDALRGEQSQTHHIDVEPGQSVPLRGTVTVRDGVDPKIVADARYALPNGGEGHLAALFGIDTSNDEPEAQVEDVLERV